MAENTSRRFSPRTLWHLYSSNSLIIVQLYNKTPCTRSDGQLPQAGLVSFCTVLKDRSFWQIMYAMCTAVARSLSSFFFLHRARLTLLAILIASSTSLLQYVNTFCMRLAFAVFGNFIIQFLADFALIPVTKAGSMRRHLSLLRPKPLTSQQAAHLIEPSELAIFGPLSI